MLALALLLAVAFAATNGVHDASNAIAVLVATRAARPGQAIALASVCNLAGPLLIGSAVAHTVAGIVTIPDNQVAGVAAAGLGSAVVWNLLTWRLGLPSSSGHALIGGLAGAALAAGGTEAVRWGGLDGWHPVGAFGTLIALAVSPVLGAGAAWPLVRSLRHLGRRATRRWRRPVRDGQWATATALAMSHGANDAQKSVGVMAALLLAAGHPGHARLIELVSAAALTAGTALGGWRIVRTVGRGIYRLRPIEGLAGQFASASVIFGGSVLGAPISTTQVVAASVIGAGGGSGRWHHVRWTVVRQMGLAWLITLPATTVLAAATFWIGSALP